MKGTVKIIAMLLVVLTVVMVSVPVFAAEGEGSGKKGKPTFTYDGYLDTLNQKADSQEGNTKVAEIAGKAIALIRNIAIVIGVVMVSIIGIKYMIGSAEEKASYKKTLIPLTVGIILVVAATSLISMIFSFANGI